MCKEEREIMLLVSEGVPKTGTSENRSQLLPSLSKEKVQENPEIWKVQLSFVH